MIDLQKMLAIVGALVVVTFGGLAIHDWGVRRNTQLSDTIHQRDLAISIRDARIANRDSRIATLVRHDSSLVRSVTKQAADLSRAKDSVVALRQQIDADAATHEGLVPLARVHEVEAKDDIALKSCEDLNRTKDLRIGGLLAQIAARDTTRAELDTNRTASDSTRRDIVKLYKPPWWKRSASWLGDHAVTLGVGAATCWFICPRRA